jgi:hypothetical protein
MMLTFVLAFAPVAFASSAQDPKDPPKKDPAEEAKKEEEFKKKVNAAIDKASKWMIDQFKGGLIAPGEEAELILLALFHAGVPKDHPFIVANMTKLLSKSTSDVYNGGLRGLLLEKVDRARYQPAIHELAIWLCQAQCKNGQWSYPGKGRLGPVPIGYQVPKKKPGKEPAKPGETQVVDDEGPAPGKALKVPPFEPSKLTCGDNSNAQYAVLGLFAAARSNIEIPKAVLEKTEKWFEKMQHADGGFSYNGSYDGESDGAMATAGVTALVVSKFYQGKDWKNDPSVQRGIDWIAKNLKYDTNPGVKPKMLFQYYWLYGVERVGQITGMKEFGGHDWYREGAEYLLSAQQADGSWLPERAALLSMSNKVKDRKSVV